MNAVRYIIAVGIIVFVGYNSVYFSKLDEVKASQSAKAFNATAYAQTYWNSKLLTHLDKAIDIEKLTAMLSADPAKTFSDYSHALGIGNLRYFLVKGRGIIESVNEDDVTVISPSDSSKKRFRIATEYIFGNAVRDATGIININEFNRTMDFNNVSAEINKIIREKVLPPFKKEARKGAEIEFTGAIELNKEHPDISNIEVVPVEINFRKS